MIKEKKAKPHYVDNKKFYSAIVEYHKKIKQHADEGKEPPQMPDYIGECIYKIANHLAYKPGFINYSFREEMIEDGIENCLLYFKSFDPEKYNNPFAYFTQVIHHAFVRRIGKEEKERYGKYKLFQQTIIEAYGTEALVDAEGNSLFSAQMYDNMNEFMEKFEAREQKKKEKRKEAKKGLQKYYEVSNERPITTSDTDID